MKYIPKELLDELIRLTRKYWKTSDKDVLPLKTIVARELSEKVFKTSYRWICFGDFVNAIIGETGFQPGAKNDVVYKAFEAVGYAIKEDE